MNAQKRENHETRFALPLKQELNIIAKILQNQPAKIKLGLDAGFCNPSISERLRKNGPQWITVEASHFDVKNAAGYFEENTIFQLLADSTFPFAERQFDCAVIGESLFVEDPKAFVQECHRILKTGGLLIFSIDRKKNTSKKNRQTSDGSKIRLSEKEIFKQLHNGFDLLGIHYSCRFWTNLVRKLPSCASRRNGEASTFKNLLYSIAAILDGFLFFSRGHRMTIHARRKSWRERNEKIIGPSTVVSDAILFNTKTAPSTFSAGRLH